MSCYFRHMRDVFEEVGADPTGENRKELDRIIHELVGVEYKSCSPAWKAVKERIRDGGENRLRFIEELRRRLP